MGACPRCGRQWPDGYQRCPDDGSTIAPMHAQTNATSSGGLALAPQPDEDLPAGSLAGEYRIEKKIGEGGMGSVYGARHPLIGKRAAIKVIRRELSTSQEAVDRFVLEAQSVNQIGHPNIVDVFGFGSLPDGRSFFVMEWLEGESLRARLQRSIVFAEALENDGYVGSWGAGADRYRGSRPAQREAHVDRWRNGDCGDRSGRRDVRDRWCQAGRVRRQRHTIARRVAAQLVDALLTTAAS